MFYWKNAVVLIGLLCIATAPILAMARDHREHGYTLRLLAAGIAVNLIATSFVSTAMSQTLYALLLLLCLGRKAPMVATYLFFLIWSPSAAKHMNIGSMYLVPLRPILSFSLALFVGYLMNPQAQLRRRWDMTDLWLFAFLLTYCICAAMRASLTEFLRNLVTYLLPYAITYQVISRLRIGNAEQLLRYLVYAGCAAGLLCFFEFVRYWPIYAGMEYLKGDGSLLDVPQRFLLRGGLFRAFGPFSHPLVASAVLGVIGIALYGLALLRGWKPPILFAGFVLLLGLVGTVSRTGIVVVGAGLIAMQFVRRRYVPGTLLLFAGAIGVFALSYLSRADLQANANYRMDLFRVPLVLGHHAWLGYHEAVTNGMLDQFIQGQGIVDLVNIYVSIIVLGGVVSLLPYLAFLATTITQYRALLRASPTPPQRVLAQVCISAQVGLFAAGAFIGAWNSAMLLSFIVIAIIVALRSEARAAPEAVTTAIEPPLRSLLVGAEPLPALR